MKIKPFPATLIIVGNVDIVFFCICACIILYISFIPYGTYGIKNKFIYLDLNILQ